MVPELAYSFFVVVCVTASPRPEHYPKNAFELYARSVRESSSHNVFAIVDQHDPSVPGGQRVKVERDKKGRFRKTVLQPLSMQGRVSVDNGVRWRTVFPDERVVQDQDSPLKKPHEEAERLNLAKRNYSFTVDGEGQVAGRKVIRLLAEPHYDQLDKRRISLDSETLYPLRLECFSENHNVVEFATIEIAFPKTMDEYTFNLPDTLNMRVFKYNEPRPLRDQMHAERELGFRPIVPTRVGLGFEIQEEQVSNNSNYQTLVLRLTDGLARATVYEFSVDAQVDVSSIENRSVGTMGTVRVMVVASMPEEARDLLLRCFTPDDQQLVNFRVPPVNSLSRFVEPNRCRLALANLDKSSPLSGTNLADRFRRATEGAWTLCRS